jgi:hypothetical protein
MPEIGPGWTIEDLEKTAEATAMGGTTAPGLPGLKTDAKEVNREAYIKNGELADAINEALHDIKETQTVEDQPRFVLGWRMYPNIANPYWKGKMLHSCGCACGCSSRKTKAKRPRP